MLINAEVPIIPEEQLIPSLQLKGDVYNLSIQGTKHGDFETDIATIMQNTSAYSPQLADQLKAHFVMYLGSIPLWQIYQWWQNREEHTSGT
jgi:hypothetical protein